MASPWNCQPHRRKSLQTCFIKHRVPRAHHSEQHLLNICCLASLGKPKRGFIYLSTFRQLKQNQKRKIITHQWSFPRHRSLSPCPVPRNRHKTRYSRSTATSPDTAHSPGKGHTPTSGHTFPIARVIPVERTPRTALNNYRLAFIPSPHHPSFT